MWLSTNQQPTNTTTFSVIDITEINSGPLNLVRVSLRLVASLSKVLPGHATNLTDALTKFSGSALINSTISTTEKVVVLVVDLSITTLTGVGKKSRVKWLSYVYEKSLQIHS